MTRGAFTCSRCRALLARVRDGHKPALVVAPGVDPVVDLRYRRVTLWCPCGAPTGVEPPRRVQLVAPERRAV